MRASTAATGSRRGSTFIRIVTAPLRALRRARDLYVSSMTGCAGRLGHGAGAALGYTGGCTIQPPRSFSFHMASRASSSSEDDLRELIRAASQGAMGSLNLGGAALEGPPPVPRSQSVAIGRIDEDRPCDFAGDYAMAGPLYPRSRSYAVSKRKVGVIG